MAINKTQRGFALLIAVIFMSVMLTLGLVLASLGYKQEVLASSALMSQYSFYAADAALECVLLSDQQNAFAYPASPPASAPTVTCDGNASIPLPLGTSGFTYTANDWIISMRFSLDAPAPGQPGKHCADVTVYKYSAPQPVTNITTYIFSRGYNVPCSTVENPPSGERFASRGLNAHY